MRVGPGSAEAAKPKCAKRGTTSPSIPGGVGRNISSMSHRVRRRARIAAPPVDPPDQQRVVAWLLVALAIPRLIRILYPAVWVEDDLLLQSALAVSRGLRPYLEFDHAQMPALEWLAGLYVRVAGASHVSMEILNGAAIYATSVLLFLVARRAIGSRAAAAASLLYACHSLVFRYHVWAREFFVSALVLAALLVLLGERLSMWTRIAAAGALFCAACAVKLTAGVAVAAVCVYVALVMRAPLRAAALALAVGAGLSAVVALCYWRYGDPFVYQTFLFHFLKGRNADAGPSYIASLLDVLGPLALLGLWHVARPNRWSHALGLAGAVLVSYLLFFGTLSPTTWGHNYLEAWPFVCLLAGAGVAWLVDAWQTSWLRTAAAAAIALACLVWITPLGNEASLRGSVYGFGFVPRREVSELAAALRAATGRDEPVIAPSFIAFEANRLQAIRYPESRGVMQTGEDLRQSAGFAAARERFGSRNFFDLINDTSDVWNREVVRAIAPGGRVNAMIPDSDIQLLPLVDASPAALSDRGFRLALRTAHFTLWLRHAPSSTRHRTENVSGGM